MMGHVNNATFLSYIELARLKYFDDVIGGGRDWTKQDGLILARIEIDFRMPVFFGDTVAVHTRCSRLGNKSFDLAWKVMRELSPSTEIVAEGTAVLACYDYLRKESILIPQERRAAIEAFEGTIL
jgi:acyl-CoA thioester hydrolase